MKPIPEEIKIKMVKVLEQSRSKRESPNSGVYIGQATNQKLFIPRQAVYKIGHTSNLASRKKFLKRRKIQEGDIYFVEVDVLPVLAEGLFHSVLCDEKTKEYIPFEREWFYLSEQSLEWLHSFEALDYRLLNQKAYDLAKSFENSEYNKEDMRVWFRKYHWGG